jgi:DNA-binding SARP family transcriptional activator
VVAQGGGSEGRALVGAEAEREGWPGRDEVVLGLIRPRLMQRLAACRIGLITAPAGWGKTTLLWHHATEVHGPVAWCTGEGQDGRAKSFLAHLTATVGPAVGVPDARWSHPGELLRALSAVAGPVLLVVDEVQCLIGTEAEVVLAKILANVPASVRVLLAGRAVPGLDLSRLRVSGTLVELGPDELKFRTWEVEQLFRSVYREPLIPEAVAELTRRTGGWAACLQLFHLATRGRSPGERRLVLAGLESQSRLVREYLARQVLEDVPENLRIFMLRTSLLRHPTGPLCDALLGRTDSDQLLAELARRQLCTISLDVQSIYAYPEILRSYLEGELMAGLGPDAGLAELRRAAGLLAQAGQVEEALWAYGKAGDQRGTWLLQAGDGDALTAAGNCWIESIPRCWAGASAWLEVAWARQALGQGRFQEALVTYRQAMGLEGPLEARETASREGAALAPWTEAGSAQAGEGWLGALREALAGQPRQVAVAMSYHPGAPARLAEGVAWLVHGDWERAASALWAAGMLPDASMVIATLSRLLAALAEVGLERSPSVGLDLLAEHADSTGLLFMIQAAGAVPAVAGLAEVQFLAHLERAAQRAGNSWGAALMGLLQGLREALAGSAEVARLPSAARTIEALERAGSTLSSLGAGVLAAWCSSLRALQMVRAGDTGAAASAQAAALVAEGLGAAGPAGMAHLALAAASGTVDDLDRARSFLIQVGLWDRAWLQLARWPRLRAMAGSLQPPGAASAGARSGPARLQVLPGGFTAAPPGPAAPSPPHPVTASLPEGPPVVAGSSAVTVAGSGAPTIPGGLGPGNGLYSPVTPVQLRCFGAFSIAVGGTVVDLSQVKPKPRELLRLLAAHAGRPVHREVLVEALWPGADPAAGVRSLQVAISTLRRALEPNAGRGESRLVVREGDAYRLALPEGSDADIVRFEACLAEARRTEAAGDPDATSARLQAALATYRDALLVEDGPAEWVTGLRRRYQSEAAWAALTLGRLELERGNAQAAATAGERGVAIDPYRDELWRLLIEAHRQGGDRAAAQRARASYREILAELGLSSSIGA